MSGFGNSMLLAGLAMALLSLSAYVSYSRGGKEQRGVARGSFVVSALAVLAASVALMYAFLAGRYDIQYVAGYSSSDLPLIYRISAFWAGQEGSFLLWALMGAAIGLALMRQAGSWEGPLMALFNATQAFLLLLMVIRSPFAPGDPGAVEGHGLNPLLQDPWMAIHPPLIFLGYAALAVPFVFAIAALLRRDYDGWVARALPWTLFAWVGLGAGIFVGGYWAYRVLGWGGYWGWDPVENASLIPWLLATALLHGMLAQRARGTMKRTTLLLAVASFVMVLYGTFLTRSGVLADFSVHSFAEAGAALYWTLVLGMVLSLVAPAILFVRRVREIETDTTYDNLASRDFSFFFGMLVLFISAAIVTFGTSAPILSSVLARLGFDVKPASLQPGFYNRTHYPVAVLLGIIMAMAPLLSWRHTAAEVIRKRLTPHGVVALIGTAAAFLIGVRSGWMLLLIAASLLCLSVAVGVLRRALRENPLHAGAPLSHVGLALMLIGIVGSSVYSRSEKLVLHPGETKEALGYRVKLLGTESPSETRREMKLTLSRGGSEFAATPRMVFSPQMNSWVHSPAVRKYLLQDIYVSPVELRQSEDPGAKHGELGKGESLKAGGYTFTFEKFDMSGHGDGGGSIGAVVKVQQPDGKSATVVPSVTPSESSELVPHPAKLPGTGISVELAGIAVPRVQLSITGLPTAAPAGPREEVVVDVSNKPLINVLWLGTVLVLTGGLVAAVRRSGEAARVEREALQQATEAAGNGHRRRERHKVPSAR